jgi:hypothetical protein
MGKNQNRRGKALRDSPLFPCPLSGKVDANLELLISLKVSEKIDRKKW